MKTKTKIFGLGWRPWILIALLIAIAVLAVLQLSHTTHFFSHTSTPNTTYYPGPHTSTGGQNTKGQTNNVPSIVQSNPSPKSSQSSVSPNPSTSNAYLITPTGNFVNEHNVQQATGMFSDCNTTPGATCEITFTNVGTGATVTLTPTLADSNGAAYWQWTPKSIRLGVGSTWKIMATATLGGQSKSASDATNLEVGQ